MAEATSARGGFSGKLGFILATAGSAVGLGNLWRFPYLAASYGGGIFVLVYIILAFTFGYALMNSEIIIGRMTGTSTIKAFTTIKNNAFSKFGGFLCAAIPLIIAPYYCVIGGWVLKYLFAFIVSSPAEVAEDTYFTDFISNPWAPELFFLIFAVMAVGIVVFGVEKGVERFSKMMMPALIVLAIILAVFSITRPGAMEGVKYFLIPKFSDFSIMTIVAALGQMFYSLSIAMGILITYGSYMKRDTNVTSASRRIIIFDSGVAILAGLIIIPAVFAFSGGDPAALNAGPSLMFITLPNVFASMGIGKFVAILFFILVLFAALTSAISLTETTTSIFQDQTGWSRKKCANQTMAIILILGSLSSLGYGPLSFVKILGMSFLDFFDFITNSVMMPIAAFCICILVIFYIGRKRMNEEIRISSPFRDEKFYHVLIRFICPIGLAIVAVSSILNAFGIITI